jgi:tRNA nucleotidyltransferase (CCA-adding enzyme)
MKDTITTLKNLFPQVCHARIFLVGGSVRDSLLGREHKDIDLAAALTEAELVSCGFRLVAGRSTKPIWFRSDAAFGIIELTPLPDSTALHADLAGRDFSINALAMDLAGILIDPLNGRGDLEQGLLRPCSPRTFSDDPLRIFRAFRFESGGWRMTKDTEALLRERDWSDSFAQIPVERFSREMIKALSSRKPDWFFQRMVEFGIGDGYLPELFRMSLIPAGPLKHHPEGGLLTHSLQVLQRVALYSADPLARFCAFFHDIGKLATDPSCYPKHHGHDQAGFNMARNLCDQLRLPAAYRSALSWISRLHGKYTLWEQLRDSTKIRVAGQAVNAGVVEILPLVAAADKAAGTEISTWAEAVRIVRMTTAELGIGPEQMATMPPERRADYILQKRVEEFRYNTRR